VTLPFRGHCASAGFCDPSSEWALCCGGAARR